MGPRDDAGAVRPGPRLRNLPAVALGFALALGVPLGDPLAAQAPAASVPPARDTLRIIHVGDINFARTVASRYILPGRGASVLANVAPALKGADITIGNLESVLVERGALTDPPGSMIFSGPPAGAGLLVDAGFDVVTTANNHVWDRGYDGLLESLRHLDGAGLGHAGTGASSDEAWKPAIVRTRGWTVAVFSMTRIFNGRAMFVPGQGATCCVAWADTLRFRREAQFARDALGADIVLASIHQGREYMAEPSPYDAAVARGMIRAGADAVIGHHPHVPQGVEWVDGKPVIHSLGNFVFLQNQPWTRTGLLAELVFTPERRVALRMRPVNAGLVPGFPAATDSARAMRYVDSLSRSLPPPRTLPR